MKYINKVNGVIALIIFALLTLGFINAVLAVLKPDYISHWIRLLGDNWIILIFKMNIALAQYKALTTLHLIDIMIMFLVGMMFLVLIFSLKRKNMVWMIFSIFGGISPFLGIILLLISHTAGRSGLLTGGFIFSILMLLSKIFGKVIAITGMLGSLILLIACDFVSQITLSPANAVMIIIGYLFWMGWFLLIAIKYFQLNKLTIR